MSRYSKALFAFIASLATWGVTAAADGVYDPIELWTLLGVAGSTLGVYVIPNTPPQGEPRNPAMSETAKPVPEPPSLPVREVVKKAAKKR